LARRAAACCRWSWSRSAVFVGIAIAAFAYAFYRLYLRPAPCAPGEACAVPANRRRQRIAFWVTLIGAKALIVSPYVYAALLG